MRMTQVEHDNFYWRYEFDGKVLGIHVHYAKDTRYPTEEFTRCPSISYCINTGPLLRFHVKTRGYLCKETGYVRGGGGREYTDSQ